MLALLAIFITAPTRAADAETLQNPALKRFYSELQTIFRNQYPDVTSDLLKDKIHFECDTRLFIVHEEGMSGRWLDPWEERGPKPGGILCDITLEKGKYQGQAIVPQTIDKRYFKFLMMAPYSEKQDIHLIVYLSYPQNVSDDFLKRFTKLVNSFDKYFPAETGGKPAVQGLTLVIVSSWPAWEPARRESLANPSPASD